MQQKIQRDPIRSSLISIGIRAGIDISELGLCHQYNGVGDVFLYYNTDCPSRPVASLEAEARGGQFEKLIVDSCQLLATATSYSSRFLLFAFHYLYAYGLFSMFRGLKTITPGLPTIYVRNSWSITFRYPASDEAWRRNVVPLLLMIIPTWVTSRPALSV